MGFFDILQTLNNQELTKISANNEDSSTGVLDADNKSDGLVQDLFESQDRLVKYRDYDLMEDRIPEVASALDIIADDITSENPETSTCFWIKSDHENTSDMLNDFFFEKLNLNEDLWSMMRDMVKYGDEFEEVVVSQNGIKSMKPLHPSTMYRYEDEKGNLLKFEQKPNFYFNSNNVSLYASIPNLNYSSIKDSRIEFVPWQIVHSRIRSQNRSTMYGTSFLERIRHTATMLRLMEESLAHLRLQKSFDRFMIFLDVGCFTGDTKISLLDGTERSFEDLYNSGDSNFWVYTCAPDGTIDITKTVGGVKLTKYVSELVEVTLDNNEKVKCTLDHKWMLRDGTYREAKDLVPGDSLMPLYRSTSIVNLGTKDYLQYMDNEELQLSLDLNIIRRDELERNIYELENKICDLEKTDFRKKFREFYEKEMSNSVPVNHKVLSIKFLNMDTPIAVYDITTESDNHNFALSSGVFVHNSLDPSRSLEYVRRIQQMIKRKRFIKADGSFESSINPITPIDDVYLPLRKGDNSRIEKLPGLDVGGRLDDIKYYKQKLLSGLKIPAAYLGFTEDYTGFISNVLAQQDKRYLRTIRRYQVLGKSLIKRIGDMQLLILNYPYDEREFEVFISSSNQLDVQAALEIQALRAELANNLRDVVPLDYIMKNVLDIPEKDIQPLLVKMASSGGTMSYDASESDIKGLANRKVLIESNVDEIDSNKTPVILKSLREKGVSEGTLKDMVGKLYKNNASFKESLQQLKMILTEQKILHSREKSVYHSMPSVQWADSIDFVKNNGDN